MINNCLQCNHIPLGVATEGDYTIALSNGKVSREARLKQKTISLKLHF
jgi:hypothetical protein